MCCTGMTDDEKEDIDFKAQAMSAEFSLDLQFVSNFHDKRFLTFFRTNATHLIAKVVASEKYNDARCRGCSIVCPEWLRACWASYTCVDAAPFKLQTFAGYISFHILLLFKIIDMIDRSAHEYHGNAR
jgi:hypothetical protein